MSSNYEDACEVVERHSAQLVKNYSTLSYGMRMHADAWGKPTPGAEQAIRDAILAWASYASWYYGLYSRPIGSSPSHADAWLLWGRGLREMFRVHVGRLHKSMLEALVLEIAVSQGMSRTYETASKSLTL